MIFMKKPLRRVMFIWFIIAYRMPQSKGRADIFPAAAGEDYFLKKSGNNGPLLFFTGGAEAMQAVSGK